MEVDLNSIIEKLELKRKDAQQEMLDFFRSDKNKFYLSYLNGLDEAYGACIYYLEEEKEKALDNLMEHPNEK